MDFKGQDGRKYHRFEILDEEITRARMGFEALGSDQLSKQVDTMVLHGISDIDKARLTVAGNLALINILTSIPFPDANTPTINEATTTVHSGLAAIAEAEAIERQQAAAEQIS